MKTLATPYINSEHWHVKILDRRQQREQLREHLKISPLIQNLS
jgi:predicted DNA-binding protein (MmcQ/YjbR family)